jgi:ubiquinone/menaquinone biosynthesis C-methylase UbiE
MVSDPAERGTDTEVLRNAAYADRDKLDDRRSIYEFRRPRFDLVASVLDHLPVGPGGRVLDLGCGPGIYLSALAGQDPSLRLFGADLSVGMLRSARQAGAKGVLTTQAVALPFPDDAFDAAMANNMLYHVDPIVEAAAELRRVVRAGGSVLAVTNGRAHFAEFDALLAEVSGRDGWWRPSHRFTMENGASPLETAFDQVETVWFTGELEVPEAGPVLRFARSMRDLSGEGYDDQAWDDLMTAFEMAVDDVIADQGAFRTRTVTGVFICR